MLRAIPWRSGLSSGVPAYALLPILGHRKLLGIVESFKCLVLTDPTNTRDEDAGEWRSGEEGRGENRQGMAG